MEKEAEVIEEKFRKNMFLPNTGQPTYGKSGSLKRTKYFFNSRYMWSRQQLAEPQSNVAAGVRTDVSRIPNFITTNIIDKLVDHKVIPENFINHTAVNIYHDGTEGLGQHFDDAVRFSQPIFTLRLFSDSRLSFGNQLYGFCNGAFTIPLPRGCICAMLEGSYASNGIKHCVRPADMTGKSAAIIMRQIHPFIQSQAEKYDVEVDLPT